MIVQTASGNNPNLLIRQTDHAVMSGQFAAAFGNEQFAPLQPAEFVIYVATHHDDGWKPIDGRFEQDPNTGYPYHLTQTPLPYLIQTSAGSPAANEQHHAYCGILSSMHTYGLFNGRYGLSDKIFINLVPDEHKAAIQAMLADELARQKRLLVQLTQDEETAVWVTEEMLFHNYKLLQFFDTLALYFHMTHPNARAKSQFLNVPRALGEDVTIEIEHVRNNRYRLSPYPFRNPEMTFSYQGQLIAPQPIGTDLTEIMTTTKPLMEQVILIK
ncbi:MAG: DUF3891 family protein [Chloroflexi bacterium]|nr:DUF3891 family protein [Chloroflexota bacterium]